MSIDNMTFGELKQIASMFSSHTTQQPHPMAGKYVILRCYSAGVHAGELVSQNGDQAILKNSRRLWNWKAKSGVALSGVAINGLAEGCKIDTLVPEIALTGVIETIPCSLHAKETINAA